ncbi:MAG: DNA topoisomerase [Opitutaceae bacterium]|nr:DNA topoisomerase [Opitutaceae bacterium]
MAEKFLMAQAIARALMPGQGRRETAAFFGSIDGEPAAIAWADGHLLELADLDVYHPAWAEWRLADLPLSPPGFNFQLTPRDSAPLNQLCRVLEKASRVVNACDAAREGELIFDEIARWSGLYRRQVPLARMWIDDTTPAGLRSAWAGLADHQDRRLLRLRQQARVRAESDFLWGVNLTRYATLALRGQLDLKTRFISIGRVRSPVLALIADRCREVYGHEPEPFYQGHLTFVNEQGEPCLAKLLAPPEHKFGERDTDWARREVLDERINFIHLNRGQPWEVVEGEMAEKREYPPPLFDLTDLQRTANRLLRWPARHTSRVAQALYARYGAISYPRTDCHRLPESMEAPVLDRWREFWRGWVPPRFPDALEHLPKVEPARGINFAEKVTDHYAIIPTGLAPPPAAAPDGGMTDEYALWELIVQRFITAFLPAAKVLASSRAFVLAYQPGEQLRALVKRAPILTQGWLAYEFHTSTTRGIERPLDQRLQDEVLPVMGPLASLDRVQIKRGHTYPPEFFTYDLLLDKMNRLRLGTASTRAEVIADLIDLGYLGENSSRALVVTEEGEKIVTLLRTHGGETLLDPKLTAFWEHQLDAVGRGAGRGLPREQLLADLIEQIKEQGLRLCAPGEVDEVVFCPKTGLRVEAVEGGWRFPGWHAILCKEMILGRKMKASEYRDIFLAGKEGGGPYENFISKRTGASFRAWLRFEPKAQDFKFVFKTRRR